jgi:hypothetical protein
MAEETNPMLRQAQANTPQPPVQQKKTPELNAVIGNLAEVAANVRVLEDRYANLRKKMQLTEQSLLDMQKNLYKDKKLLTDELTEAKMKLQDLIDDLASMKGELKDTVKQNDLKVLDRYLDMWEPLQFVSRKEVEALLNSLEEKQENNNQANK